MGAPKIIVLRVCDMSLIGLQQALLNSSQNVVVHRDLTIRQTYFRRPLGVEGRIGNYFIPHQPIVSCCKYVQIDRFSNELGYRFTLIKGNVEARDMPLVSY